jgi:hypothetical protein
VCTLPKPCGKDHLGRKRSYAEVVAADHRRVCGKPSDAERLAAAAASSIIGRSVADAAIAFTHAVPLTPFYSLHATLPTFPFHSAPSCSSPRLTDAGLWPRLRRRTRGRGRQSRPSDAGWSPAPAVGLPPMNTAGGGCLLLLQRSLFALQLWNAILSFAFVLGL